MRSLAANGARIAARQRGRITTEQLEAVGVDRHRIKRWAADGRLRREHEGAASSRCSNGDVFERGARTAAELAALLAV